MKNIIIIIVAVVVLIAAYWFFKPVIPQSIGSVSVSSEYNATSTVQGWWPNPGVAQNTPKVLSLRPATLGQLIITKAGSAGTTLSFFNATTTDTTTGNSGRAATSTLLMITVPSDLAAGTYTYDAMFDKGILLITTTTFGNFGSTTITWR